MNKRLYSNWLKGNWKTITRKLPDIQTALPSPGEAVKTWGRRGVPCGKDERGGGDEPWSYGAILQHFRWRNTHIHTLSSGPLGPEEMSVCGLIQPPVPVLMMASTCCFNVTAGSPSIPHWLWLPSAAGSSPLHTPPSISSAIPASFICLHFHLLSPTTHLNLTFSHPSLCYTSASFQHLHCSGILFLPLPRLHHFCPFFLFPPNSFISVLFPHPLLPQCRF